MAITVVNVGSGYKRSSLNENFETLRDEINNNCFRRQGLTGGEANQLEHELDMNSNKITNLADAVASVDAVNLGQLEAAKVFTGITEVEIQALIDASVLIHTTVSLSDYYVDGDTALHQAWARMIADIETVDSAASKATQIYLGAYPGAASGIWPHSQPVQIPSGFTLLGGSVEWVNTDVAPVYKRQRGMFEAIGTTAASPVALNADVVAGANILTLTSTAGMEVGDFVNVEFTNVVDQTTGIFPIIYTFAKITEVTATTIRINTTIDWDIDRAAILLADAAATFTVTHYPKETVPTGIRVKDVYVLDSGAWVDAGSRSTVNPEQPDYVIGPFYFQYCENVQVSNVYGKELKCPLVQFREYADCLAVDCYSEYPLAISAGEGYTVQMSRGCRGTQLRIGGYETRHVCDFTSGNDLKMVDCWDDTPDSTRVSFLLHGRYESNVKMDNLKGNRIGLGAGFTDFGNFIKNWDLTGSAIKEMSGRGAIGVSSIRNTEIGYTYGSLYFEHLTLDNCFIPTGDTQWNRETRLSSPIVGNGLYITNGSRIRAIQLKGYDRVVFDSTTLSQNGGGVTDPVIVDSVSDLILDGVHDNKRYKLINSCQRLTVNPTARFRGPNPTDSGGFIHVTDLTDAAFTASISGFMSTEYVGASYNRPFLFEQGTGTAYTLNLQVNGLNCLGPWDEAARIVTNVTLVGSCTGSNFEATGSINYIDDPLVGTRQPFPSTFRCGGNYYADDARNYDNVNRVFTVAINESITTKAENTIIMTVPAYVDTSGGLLLTHSFVGVVAAKVAIRGVWQDGTSVKARFYNDNTFTYNLVGDLVVSSTLLP